MSIIDLHPTAIVSTEAKLGDGCTVGPYSIIGAGVVLGSNNRIGPHVVIEGNTEIGHNNEFFQFCSVGSRPQDLKYRGEASKLVIGNNNIVREYVTLQPGTEGGGMLTSIGDQNLFMANSHIGHDCHVGNYNILANSVGVSGHVTIGNRVIIGGLSGVHQFVRMGDLCFVAGLTRVQKDIPPYCMAYGDDGDIAGLNLVGLKRAGFSSFELSEIKQLYRDVFFAEGTLRSRIDATALKNEKVSNPNPKISLFLDFLKSSVRGTAQPKSKKAAKPVGSSKITDEIKNNLGD